MVVIYDQHSTEGLTAEDMVQAVSAQYGAATRPATEIDQHAAQKQTVQ